MNAVAIRQTEAVVVRAVSAAAPGMTIGATIDDNPAGEMRP
jgi:hypothetical protein